MKKYFIYFANTILKSELLKNASILISGTILAQLISILLQPFLRRFFLPESFGLFSVYMSIVGILLTITTFKYDDAIVLPSKDKDSANLISLSLIIAFSISVFLFIVLLIFHGDIHRALNLPSGLSGKIIYVVPLSIFLYASYQSFNYWLIRKKKYVSVSVNKLTRRGAEGFAQVLFALIKNPKGLIWGDIIGQSVNVMVVTAQTLRNGFNTKYISVRKMLYVASKYSEFPKYSLLPAFMSSCSFFLPPIFINRFYSAEYTGYFDLSKLLLSIPLALVATSLSNVLLQKVSEKFKQKQSIYNDVKPIFLFAISIVFVEIVAIQLIGVWLFSFLFGEQWIASGQISKILVWSYAFNFLVSSFSSVFIAMRKIKLYSLWQFAYFSAILSLLLFKNLSFNGFILVYTVFELVCFIALAIMTYFLIHKYEHSLNEY